MNVNCELKEETADAQIQQGHIRNKRAKFAGKAALRGKISLSFFKVKSSANYFKIFFINLA
jgi:hypothetical protein